MWRRKGVAGGRGKRRGKGIKTEEKTLRNYFALVGDVAWLLSYFSAAL